MQQGKPLPISKKMMLQADLGKLTVRLGFPISCHIEKQTRPLRKRSRR